MIMLVKADLLGLTAFKYFILQQKGNLHEIQLIKKIHPTGIS